MARKLFALTLALLLVPAASWSASVSGELKKWHTVTIDFAGPAAGETDNAPNPFLAYRLQLLLTAPSGRQYDVPGFFDGDGAGGGSGAVWRVRFTPDEPGTWHYLASFRSGANLAVSLVASAGTPTGFDGETGSFTVADRDAAAPGNLSKGRLDYVGEHYLKYADGPYYIKGGVDSPENYLAYEGFDNTTTSRFTLHGFDAHAADWQAGDPDWGSGKGRAIIGTLNYLAAQHVNSIYVMPMNIGGDGQDCWPFAGTINPAGSSSNDNLHYDISKLAQWEIFFDHADRKGMLIHMVLNEAERNNKLELDSAALGVERKLYYRELAARFGHHLALQWNMSEEYNLTYPITPIMIQLWADYLRSVDPYDHPIAVHNSYDVADAFEPFLDSIIDVMSIQVNNADFGAMTEQWRKASRDAGKTWAVMFDEFDRCGKIDDDSHSDAWPNLSGHGYIRKKILWSVLLGGGGLEYILQDLLDTEDFKPYEPMWRYTWYARKFLEQNTRFWEMDSRVPPPGGGADVSADTLVRGEDPDFGGAQVFCIPGEQYAIYLPDASNDDNNLDGNSAAPPELDLRAYPNTRYIGRWYNPRTGQFAAPATNVTLTGGTWASLGRSPDGINTNDWALLVELDEPAEPQLFAVAGEDMIVVDADGNGSEIVTLDGSASHHLTLEIVQYLWSENGLPLGIQAVSPLLLSVGDHTVTLTVIASDTSQADDEIVVSVRPAGSLTPGDTNGDGTVDIQDFVILKQHYGLAAGAAWSHGDFNGDGAVDIQDFVALKRHYGTTP